MKKLSLLSACTMLMLLFISTSCLKTSDPPQQPAFKIGLVGGLGTFSDAGFNQAILTGFRKAAADFPIVTEARESRTTADFTANINYFLANSFDFIITCGYDAAQATLYAANAHKGTAFLILDYAMTTPPANVLCAVFDVDQSSFPCGFLAAYWAFKQNPAQPVTGFIGGPEISEIRQFSVSYAHGIAYFNSKYNQHVVSKGYYASSFTDSLQGARLADSLVSQNASVIFAFAGSTGNGALYKVKDAGKWAIGVDVDQYISIPAVGPVLLTSCMKGLDIMVYNVIYGYVNYYFPGGTVIHGNLANSGVGIAPFHMYDAQIPDSIKVALSNIATGIKDGTIKTGWPE